MTIFEVRERLQQFWSLKGEEQEEYFRSEILPQFHDAFIRLDNRFIRQVIRVIEERGRKRDE